MKRKDIISFVGMFSYMIIVFGGMNLYFSSDKNDSLEKLAIRKQKSEVETTRICKEELFEITILTSDNCKEECVMQYTF